MPEQFLRSLTLIRLWRATVILDRDPKLIISCPSGRQAEQSFMMAAPVPKPAMNSFSWIECSGKASGKVFSAIVDFQVLKVDARYKIRYDEDFGTT